MNIILISNSKLSASLAQALSQDGNHVCTLDQYGNKRSSITSLMDDNSCFKGMQFDSQGLVEADIEHADALLAVSDDDNINLMAALIAKEVYHIPNVVAKANNPDKSQLFNMLHIASVNPVPAEADLIKNTLSQGSHVLPVDKKAKRGWLHSIS